MRVPQIFCFLWITLILGLPIGESYSEEAKEIWKWGSGKYLPQALVANTDGKSLFIALKSGGITVLDIHNQTNSRQISNVSKEQLGNMDAMNLTLINDRFLVVALGNFFGANSHAGIAVIDVSSPRNPRVTSLWKSKKPLHGSAVVAVKGRHAYLGAMEEGVMVFDLSDPKVIRHLATYQPDIHFPTTNPNKIQHPNARGIAITGNLLYLCYDAGGIRVLNIKNPQKPTEIGRYINVAMNGKQQAYNNILIDGSRAFVAIDYAGFEVLDISEPSRIKQMGWWNPWEAETLKNTWFNSPGHTN